MRRVSLSLLRSARTRAIATSIGTPAIAHNISVSGILARERRPLAKAITLVESENPTHAGAIGALLRELQSARSGDPLRLAKDVRRVAISGSPGAGKSCFIEALGMHLVNKGLNVAVLAIDPSSTVSGGSILGDKTRMTELSMHPRAFVRPSPSRGHLGGVTARCWEAMEILEAASYDVILIETVGVGQSEIAAKDVTDCFVLLVPPAAGDELQGVKKGIAEIADIIVVTKMDGAREQLALETKMQYTRAAAVNTQAGGTPVQVLCVSAHSNIGIDAAWEAIDKLWLARETNGEIAQLRQVQRVRHFHMYFEHELVARAKSLLGASLDRLERRVQRQSASPREAAEEALRAVLADPASVENDCVDNDLCLP